MEYPFLDALFTFSLQMLLCLSRATALQKMIDEAEYAANVAKNKNSYNNGNKNSHGMGLPNSSRANKLRRDRYDEPDRFTDFD